MEEKILNLAKELQEETQVFRATFNFIVDTFEEIKGKKLGAEDMNPETFNKIEDFCDWLIYCSKAVKSSEYEEHKELN